MSLIEHLKHVKDFRTQPRYELWVVLLLVIMGTMSGCTGYRALHNRKMKCPQCESTQVSKNGQRHGKQNYICRDCRKQFVEFYDLKGYSDDIKRQCLEMYVNGMGFRAIERIKGVHHTTLIYWVKPAVNPLADAPEYSEIPEVAQDELQTFVGSKTTRFGYGQQSTREVREF